LKLNTEITDKALRIILSMSFALAYYSNQVIVFMSIFFLILIEVFNLISLSNFFKLSMPLGISRKNNNDDKNVFFKTSKICIANEFSPNLTTVIKWKHQDF